MILISIKEKVKRAKKSKKDKTKLSLTITTVEVKEVEVAEEAAAGEEVEVAEDVIMTTKIEKIVPKMKTNGFTSSIMKNSESSTITTLQLSLVRAKFQKCLLKKKD